MAREHVWRGRLKRGSDGAQQCRKLGCREAKEHARRPRRGRLRCSANWAWAGGEPPRRAARGRAAPQAPAPVLRVQARAGAALIRAAPRRRAGREALGEPAVKESVGRAAKQAAHCATRRVHVADPRDDVGSGAGGARAPEAGGDALEGCGAGGMARGAAGCVSASKLEQGQIAGPARGPLLGVAPPACRRAAATGGGRRTSRRATRPRRTAAPRARARAHLPPAATPC